MKPVWAQYYTILKTELKFYIFFITGCHTLNIPIATATQLQSVGIKCFQAFFQIRNFPVDILEVNTAAAEGILIFMAKSADIKISI